MKILSIIFFNAKQPLLFNYHESSPDHENYFSPSASYVKLLIVIEIESLQI